jgi:hypothetical protein
MTTVLKSIVFEVQDLVYMIENSFVRLSDFTLSLLARNVIHDSYLTLVCTGSTNAMIFSLINHYVPHHIHVRRQKKHMRQATQNSFEPSYVFMVSY